MCPPKNFFLWDPPNKISYACLPSVPYVLLITLHFIRKNQHLHDICGACGVASNSYHESCSCNSKSFPEKIYILPIPHSRLWLAYDQVMERVGSCVYENHVIPPVTQEHKSHYILPTSIWFFASIFQVNIKGLCLGHVNHPLMVKALQYYILYTITEH